MHTGYASRSRPPDRAPHAATAHALAAATDLPARPADERRSAREPPAATQDRARRRSRPARPPKCSPATTPGAPSTGPACSRNARKPPPSCGLRQLTPRRPRQRRSPWWRRARPRHAKADRGCQPVDPLECAEARHLRLRTATTFITLVTQKRKHGSANRDQRRERERNSAQRTRRKKARTSSTKSFGCSSAAKWPP